MYEHEVEGPGFENRFPGSISRCCLFIWSLAASQLMVPRGSTSEICWKRNLRVRARLVSATVAGAAEQAAVTLLCISSASSVAKAVPFQIAIPCEGFSSLKRALKNVTYLEPKVWPMETPARKTWSEWNSELL